MFHMQGYRSQQGHLSREKTPKVKCEETEETKSFKIEPQQHREVEMTPLEVDTTQNDMQDTPNDVESSSARDFVHRMNSDSYFSRGTDDSEAFMKAWRNACDSPSGSEVVVPENKVYHLKPITFSGPCKPNFRFKIYRTIKASSRRSDYEKEGRRWITFKHLESFLVEGRGTINENGRIWWIKSGKIDENQVCNSQLNFHFFFKN
uniref:Pectate lyase superfamily protein domain-containing protein n=1 Tax=Lactuca sativa TaxID=4236 RepID=A0A9R1W622_LACSA|nr:hypothetical protein LSAT_V11C300112330 [Lactuca sativa]